MQFVLFTGLTFYPSGGWHDAVKTFDDLSDAIAEGLVSIDDYRWAHIVDISTGSIIWEITT